MKCRNIQRFAFEERQFNGTESVREVEFDNVARALDETATQALIEFRGDKLIGKLRFDKLQLCLVLLIAFPKFIGMTEECWQIEVREERRREILPGLGKEPIRSGHLRKQMEQLLERAVANEFKVCEESIHAILGSRYDILVIDDAKAIGCEHEVERGHRRRSASATTARRHI